MFEIPPKTGPGTVNDAFFRFVIDTGPPGPDKGKGGKYLNIPPGYKGDVPNGYFTAKSTSWVNRLILRGFLVDGKPDVSSKLFREGVKIYPLAKAANPPKMEFINASKKQFNTIHANNYDFSKSSTVSSIASLSTCRIPSCGDSSRPSVSRRVSPLPRTPG